MNLEMHLTSSPFSQDFAKNRIHNNNNPKIDKRDEDIDIQPISIPDASGNVKKIGESGAQQENVKYYASTFKLLDNSLVYKKSNYNLIQKINKKRLKSRENQSCLYCSTTVSKLWRKGPDGYKSLCNACGLRFYRLVRKEKKIPATSTPNSIQMILNH